MQKVLIHYSEIGLKGKNIFHFERLLIENIRKSASRFSVSLKKIQKKYRRVLCDFDDSKEDIHSMLSCVFGVKNFLFVEEFEKDIDVIEKYGKTALEKIAQSGAKEVSFSTRRSDKRFPHTSVDINKRFGRMAKKLGMKVNFAHAKQVLFLEIAEDCVFMAYEKHKGPAGLPVGASGRTLTLLSGGIDSPVAAYYLMKRGCRSHFLHLHAYATNEEAKKSKICKMVQKLNDYQHESRLFLIPYHVYESHTMGKIPSSYDLVFFKHFLLKLAEKMAFRRKYHAITTGDSLGQVASQTIQNIRAVNYGIHLPVFRPLISFEKEEIMKDAEKIGTFELSIEDYKDCCSIVSKNTHTMTKLKEFMKVCMNFDMQSLLRDAIRSMDILEVTS